LSAENRILLEEYIRLDEIVIQQQLSALNVISKLILTTVLSGNGKVPGLFIGQHWWRESRANISKRV
jgi:hypothetical protein